MWRAGRRTIVSVSEGRTMSLSRLKWFAIVAPMTFLAVVGYLMRGPFHEELHEFPGYLYVLASLTVAVSVFSFLVFGFIGRVERRILEQNEHLAALLAVGRAGSSSLELADLLDAALDTILSSTFADAGEVWLVEETGELVLVRRQGAAADAFGERERLCLGEGLPGVAAEMGSTLVVRDLASDPRLARERVEESSFETFCAQPLVRRGETVGVLVVASRSAVALSSVGERRLLEGICEQLVLAIENARLHERVLDAAVLEERERLARELHDGLAQVLGYVNTQTLAIEELLSSGRREEAEAQVGRMREAAMRVYTDVRGAILGLRSTRDALLPSLRSYVVDYGRMTGIGLQLNVAAEVEALRLPSSVEIQLARIVQEALSNVRKHAQATSATVSLEVRDDRFHLEVVDDGRGFDLDQPVRTGWPHFGLQTMRERAQAIGGTFELWSRPGSGTRVAVNVPLGSPAQVRHASPAR
jgi:signal transduction histidine kinase